MKTIHPLKLSFCLILLAGLSAGCMSWGYRGPLHEWTKDDIILFDIKGKTIRFTDTTKQISFVSVYRNKKQYFERKDFSQNSNSFIIPDSLVNKIANRKITIHVIPQHMTVYSISLKATDWATQKYIYGQPINDVSNYSEMLAEIKRLNKQSTTEQ